MYRTRLFQIFITNAHDYIDCGRVHDSIRRREDAPADGARRNILHLVDFDEVSVDLEHATTTVGDRRNARSIRRHRAASRKGGAGVRRHDIDVRIRQVVVHRTQHRQ